MAEVFATLTSPKRDSNLLITEILRDHREYKTLLLFYTAGRDGSEQFLPEIRSWKEPFRLSCIEECKVDPYELLVSVRSIKTALKEHADEDVDFDVTLGTAIMTLAGVIAGLRFERVRLQYRDLSRSTHALSGLLRASLAKGRRAVILDLVERPGGATYGEIAEATGLSKANISRYVRELTDLGVVEVERKGLGGAVHVTLVSDARADGWGADQR